MVREIQNKDSRREIWTDKGLVYSLQGIRRGDSFDMDGKANRTVCRRTRMRLSEQKEDTTEKRPSCYYGDSTCRRTRMVRPLYDFPDTEISIDLTRSTTTKEEGYARAQDRHSTAAVSILHSCRFSTIFGTPFQTRNASRCGAG